MMNNSRVVPVLPKDELSAKLKVISDPTAKFAFGNPLTTTLYDNTARHRNYHYKICKEVVAMIPVVIYTKKDFFLLAAFNQKIELLKASGLIQFWHYQDIDRKIPDDVRPTYQKALTLGQLVGSFHLLFIGYALSVTVFTAEALISLIKGRNKINFW